MNSDLPGMLVALYILAIISLTVLFFVLLSRIARAQERTADATEAIARKSGVLLQGGATPPDEAAASSVD